MRLLIHTTEFPPGPGGIGVQAFEIAKELARLGWEVKIVAVQSYKSSEEIEAFNASQSFQVIRVPEFEPAWREGRQRLKVVKRLVEEWRPDVVMASGQRALWVVAMACRGHQVPWVAIVHGTELDASREWVRRLTRLALERANAIVVVSRHTGGFLRRLGVRHVPTYVIGNGANPARFKTIDEGLVDGFRSRYHLTGARPILTVGNLTARKGQEIVIRALPGIVERVPNVRYLMVGLPTEGDRLRDLSEELGVGDAVEILGPLEEDDLIAAYNCCETFVMTSQYTSDGDFEGYGIAVVEAALCGKPAVVSGDSGLEEAVVNGETALVVPQSDPEATAQALLRLLEDDDLRASLGTAARNRALAEQTWRGRASDYDRVLRWMTSESVLLEDLELGPEEPS